MADVKVSTMPSDSSPTLDDLIMTVDITSGDNKQVTLNNVNTLVSANLTAGSVTPAKLTSGLGTSWAYQTWSPTTTNITLGNGTITAKYTQIGKKVEGIFIFTLGSTSAVSGTPTFTLPVTASSEHGSGTTPGIIIGSAWALDAAVAGYPVTLRSISTTVGQFESILASGTYAQISVFSATIPFTWGTADRFGGTFSYEAA